MSKDQYRDSLRAAARGLWIPVLSAAEFKDSFGLSLDKYLKQAFDEGMARYDLMPEDYTDEDIQVMQDFLTNQYGFLDGLTDFIVAHSKPFGGSLESVLTRVELWANRYDEIRDIARTRAGADEKQEWRMGATGEHCSSCYALAGWVKRGSYWDKFYQDTGLRPRSEKLECHGYRCLCTLQPTRKAMSKGRPPIIV